MGWGAAGQALSGGKSERCEQMRRRVKTWHVWLHILRVRLALTAWAQTWPANLQPITEHTHTSITHTPYSEETPPVLCVYTSLSFRHTLLTLNCSKNIKTFDKNCCWVHYKFTILTNDRTSTYIISSEKEFNKSFMKMSDRSENYTIQMFQFLKESEKLHLIPVLLKDAEPPSVFITGSSDLSSSGTLQIPLSKDSFHDDYLQKSNNISELPVCECSFNKTHFGAWPP